MSLGATLYSAGVYAGAASVSSGAIADNDVVVFGSGFKSISGAFVDSVSINVFGVYIPKYFGSATSVINVSVSGNYQHTRLGTSLSIVETTHPSDVTTSRFGNAVAVISVGGISTAEVIVERSARAEVSIDVFAQAIFTPKVDVTQDIWKWPIGVGYDDPSVSYTRPGHHWTNGRSNVSRSRATYRFYGVQARILLPKGLNRGFVDIYIDGKHEGRQDLFDVVENNFVHNILDLEPGLHEVQLVPLGRHHPASQNSFVQVGNFAHKVGITAEDQGEEVLTDRWSATTTNV